MYRAGRDRITRVADHFSQSIHSGTPWKPDSGQEQKHSLDWRGNGNTEHDQYKSPSGKDCRGVAILTPGLEYQCVNLLKARNDPAGHGLILP